MGQDVAQSTFKPADWSAFRARLRDETKTLMGWFDRRAFDWSRTLTTGLELEAWLIDANHLPAPRNAEFLAAMDNPAMVPELSKFNFELNSVPQALAGDVFTRTCEGLERHWQACLGAGKALGLCPVAIGILPTVRDEMLQPEWMSDSNRFEALNRELFRRRQGEPLHIRIAGEDHLEYRCDHIMLEAACTSLQAHLKVNQDEAARFYNASVLAAAPLVAAAANSPFLYGRSLWAETRIPAFEQATATDGFRDSAGRNTLRVTLGTGYLRHSFLELFLENLSYPSLLPALEEDQARLPHLRLQNGTIWRWVRPILGFDETGTPHLRIEQRVMPAGPTMADTVANLALYFGLALLLGRAERPPEQEISFEEARANFYACAKDGLTARVRWAGQDVNVQTLLLDHLLPAARGALAREGVDQEDLDLWFDHIMRPRLRTGRTGADWQRSFVHCNGTNFQALTEAYVANQATGEPVHSWTV